MIEGHATGAGTGRLMARQALPAAAGFYRETQGLLVSSLGIGTYLGDASAEQDRAYEAAIRQAIGLGVNVIDTAINYRGQQSERNAGAALRALLAAGEAARDEILVCTKAGFLTPGAFPADKVRAGDVVGEVHCMAPGYLEDQIERSRGNLGVETIDVFYIHNPETQLRFIDRAEFDRRMLEAFTCLERLCAQGRLRCYGTATWSGYRLKPDHSERLDLTRLLGLAREAGGAEHRFKFLQLPVNLAMPEAFTWPYETRNGEALSLLELARENGLAVAASAPILQGRLARGIPQNLRAFFPGVRTDAQFSLQFARSTPGVTVALAGMSGAAHVEENLELRQLPPAALERYLELFRREA